jgi:hypothetical protein
MAFMGQVDERMKLPSSVLHDVLPFKYSAYEQVLIKKLNLVRDIELGMLRRGVRLIMWSSTIGYAGSSMAGAASIGIYCVMLRTGSASGGLDATWLFSILATIDLPATPLKTLTNRYPHILVMLGSLTRIQSLLALAERLDRRTDDQVLRTRRLWR